MGLALAGTAQAENLLSMSQFRERVAERIRVDHPETQVIAIGESQLRVEIPGGQTMTSTLDRAYGIYQGNPQDLPDILKGLSGTIRAHRKPATLASIVLLVRPQDYDARNDLLRRSLAGGMSAMVAQDEPDSFEFPSRGELRAELKLDDDAIWKRALQNTRARISIAPRHPDANRIEHINTGGYFASSLLADSDFWNAPAMLSEGPLVVFALARDDIYVVPLRSRALVDRLRAMTAQVRDDINGLTNDLIVWRNGRWEVLH
jgi:hypothetical protein